MAFKLPPPPRDNDIQGPAWQDWFYKLAAAFTKAASVLWSAIDFTGSKLTDILDRGHNDLQNIQGGITTERYHLTSQERVQALSPRPVFITEEVVEEFHIPAGPQVIPLDAFVTAGILVKPSFTDNLNGSVTIGVGTYALYPSTTNPKPQIFTTAGNTFVLTDLVNNYIYLSYNSGTPVLAVSTSRAAIDQITVIPVYTVYRGGTHLSYIDFDTMAIALANKISDRLARTERFAIETGGLVLGEAPTRHITTTAGVVWIAATNVALQLYDSSVVSAKLYYHVAGVWTISLTAQYNNTQYDDGTALQSLLPNRYAVNWVYREVSVGGGEAYILLGNGNYTLAEAQATAGPASSPPEILSTAILVGRIIVEHGAAVATQIDSAFAQVFSGGAAPVGLPGAQGAIGFGMDGEEGEPGMMVPGPRGAIGATGATGPTGAVSFGVDGQDGEDGVPIPGARGPQGAAGPAGLNGPVMFTEGEPGEDGLMGPPGRQGDSGSSSIGSWILAFAAAHG